jgi:hypothetical protein
VRLERGSDLGQKSVLDVLNGLGELRAPAFDVTTESGGTESRSPAADSKRTILNKGPSHPGAF